MRNLYLPCIRFGHRNYKRWISPLLGDVCRFSPSCSDYALEAIETYGLFRGSWLALKRIIRCNPLCEGGHDPVPPKESPKHKTNTRRCPSETDSNISD